MIVFSRKKTESIMIDDIRVVVLDIGKGKVELGIEGPKEISIYRGESYEAIARNMPDEIEARNAWIRERIAELKREISELEAQLHGALPPR